MTTLREYIKEEIEILRGIECIGSGETRLETTPAKLADQLQKILDETKVTNTCACSVCQLAKSMCKDKMCHYICVRAHELIGASNA